MIDDLLQLPLFREIDYEALKDIATFSSKVELNESDALISENDPDHDIYIVSEGKLEIVSSSSDIASSEVVISQQDHTLFGEMTWLTHNKRTATLRCKENVIAIKIDGDKLMDYMEKNPQVGFGIMKNIAILLALRLGNTNTTMKQILWNSFL